MSNLHHYQAQFLQVATEIVYGHSKGFNKRIGREMLVRNFGVTIEVFKALLHTLEIIEGKQYNITHLAWTLYHVKKYPTIVELVRVTGVSQKTLRKHMATIRTAIVELVPRVVSGALLYGLKE